MCMNSFLGFGSQYVERHYARSGQRAYLHITRTRKAKVTSFYIFLPLGDVSKILMTPSATSVVMPANNLCIFHRKKMTVILAQDTHPRKSPPDWL